MKPLPWIVATLIALVGLSFSEGYAGQKHKARKPKYTVSGPPPKKHQLFHHAGGHKHKLLHKH
jgi:hypothetical protein